VRGALVGWCLRLLAVAGPGRVAVVWFEEGRAEGVPAEWRAPAGASLADWYAKRLAVHAAGEEAGVRWVLVGVGPVVDGVSDVGRWVAAHAEAGVAAGVTLLLAPWRRVEVASKRVVSLVPVPGSGGRFQLLGEVLGRHEVLLQEPPPADLLERYGRWALPPEPPTGAEPESLVGGEPRVVSEPTVVASGVGAGAGGVSPPPSSAARLRALLAAPATTAPTLALGYDERRQAVEVTLGAHPQWRGGTAENAAALLATHLLEIACQTGADTWEFAVLDFSDDVRVADTFDAILDLTPHLIEYVDGVSAQLKLDDLHERLTQPASDRAHLALFVLAHSREALPDALDRVLQAGPAAGVHALVWHAGNATSSPQPGDAVLTLADTPHLRVVGQPARNLQLPTPLTTTEAATLAEPLRQARA
jgi:hypothetical protein